MKRIQKILVAIILCAVVAKANLTDFKNHQYVALLKETKPIHVKEFFEYKVNQLQMEEIKEVRSCSVISTICGRV